MKILFINRSAPYGSSLAKESLDAVLAGAAFEQDIQLLFMGDGVFQLLDKQDGQAVGQKNHSAMLSVLEMYEVNEVFVQSDALVERSLNKEDFSIAVKTLNNDEIAQLMARQDTLLSF